MHRVVLPVPGLQGGLRCPGPCPAAPSAPRFPACLSAGGVGSAQRLPSLFRAFPGFYCLPLLVPPSSQEAFGPGGAGGSVPSRTALPACSPPRRRQRHGQRPGIPAPSQWLPAAAPTQRDGAPELCPDTPSPARASLGSAPGVGVPAAPRTHWAEPLLQPCQRRCPPQRAGVRARWDPAAPSSPHAPFPHPAAALPCHAGTHRLGLGSLPRRRLRHRRPAGKAGAGSPAAGRGCRAGRCLPGRATSLGRGGCAGPPTPAGQKGPQAVPG